MRETPFATGEHYHIWNRGVDKRIIFKDDSDLDRFIKGIEQFNTPEVIGEIGRGHRVSTDPKLVEIVAYCLNPNHFHLILEQVSDRGIEKFMHKVCMGYSKYFNTKYRRSGSLFEGKFRAKYVDSNEYLLHLSAYVNLNHTAHSRGHLMSELNRTSWNEYTKGNFLPEICAKNVILGQFKDREAYKTFAEKSIKSTIERKVLIEELESAGVELVNTI